MDSMNVHSQPMTAQDEQRSLLEIMHAENELRMWRPIESSSEAGLRALEEAAGAVDAGSIVQANETVRPSRITF